LIEPYNGRSVALERSRRTVAMTSITERLRGLTERLRGRHAKTAGDKAEAAQRRAQAEALRLEYKRNTPYGGGGG
jgi:hypothetical protein